MPRRIELKTDLGDFYLDAGWYDEYGVRVDEDSEFEATLFAPDLEDEADLAQGAYFSMPRGSVFPRETPSVLKLLAFLSRLCEQIDEANEGQAEIAKQKAAEEEARRKKLAEEREATLAHRKERLMTEFIGETVVIREAGYKTMRQAVVEVVPERRWQDGEYKETGEYRLHFAYTGRDERTQHLHRMRRVDVKVGGRRMMLWDDGTDDVWGGLASSAAPVPEYDGRLSA